MCDSSVHHAPLSYKLTGKERDTESNLDYFGARYFSSNAGRFSSADEFDADSDSRDPQRWNLYAYTKNNPLKYVDPSGRDIVVAQELQATVAQLRSDSPDYNTWYTTLDSDHRISVTMVSGDPGSIAGEPGSAPTERAGIFAASGAPLVELCEWSFSGRSYSGISDLLDRRGAFTLAGDYAAFLGRGAHPYTTQHRFGGAGCSVWSSCPNSPHLSVPYDQPGMVPADPLLNVPRSGGFHVDPNGDYVGHTQDLLRGAVPE